MAVINDRRVVPEACCSSLAWLRRTVRPRMEDREEVLMRVGCESADETHRERREGRRAIVASVRGRLKWGESGERERECGRVRRKLFF